METLRPLILLLAALSAAPPLPAAEPKPDETRRLSPAAEARLQEFFADKETQMNTLAQRDGKSAPDEIKDYFDAATAGDWKKVKSLYRSMRGRAYQFEGSEDDPALRSTIWQTVNETYGAHAELTAGDEKYAQAFARDILDSIPRGGVYFGGTDPGRFLVTAFCKSHAEADPCFVLTQNALADGLYLQYLRAMYSGHLYTPSEEDSQKAFSNYLADATQRLEEGRLKPGEDVKKIDNRVQVSGQVAVMAINARLARVVFDENREREFFIEESFPLDWMYPHLTPHRLILKINREPLKELTEETVRADQDYWRRYLEPILGAWLKESTKLREVLAFADRVFVQRDLKDFNGDPKFVQSDNACKAFSKLRSAIAGVYQWRAQNTKTDAERGRMKRAAEAAFLQAVALCPSSPEVIFRYVNLLTGEGRIEDATLVAELGERASGGSRQFANLVKELKKTPKEGGPPTQKKP